MNETLAVMVIIAVFVLALLALILSYSRMHWVAKLVLVIITSGFYLLSYNGWKQVQGWPSSTPLPEKFLLHAAVIEEPDTEQGTEGQIFIWATDLKAQRPGAEPRAYALSYQQDLHRKLETALLNMRNGSIQLGSTRSADQPTTAVKTKRLGEQSQQIEFTDLADPALPEK